MKCRQVSVFSINLKKINLSRSLIPFEELDSTTSGCIVSTKGHDAQTCLCIYQLASCEICFGCGTFCPTLRSMLDS